MIGMPTVSLPFHKNENKNLAKTFRSMQACSNKGTHKASTTETSRTEVPTLMADDDDVPFNVQITSASARARELKTHMILCVKPS